ncbi:MAG: BatD family protein [Oligoflexus sp.]
MLGNGQRLKFWPEFRILAALFMLTFAVCFHASAALAGILTGELDKVEGTIDDSFVYTLTIEGQYRQEPGFPDIDGMTVRRGGTSSSVQIINGQRSERYQVSFYLTPQRTGSFEIPALVMTVDGQQQSTLPLEIIVHEANQNLNARQDLPFFVERSVNKNQLYVGEPIVVTDRIFTRVRLLEADLKRDNFPAEFRQLDNSDERRYQKQVDGRAYTVIEFQALLVPSKAGEFEIPALVLNAAFPDPSQSQRRPSMFDDLMGRTRLMKRATRSESEMIEVKALPGEGRSTKYSGLVGLFQLETELGQRSVETGENINLTVRIFGDGLSEGMSEPVTEFDSSLRVYNERPVSNDQIQGQKVVGERIFQYTLVPSKPGILDLGSVAVQIFNPQTESYEWLRSELGSIEVTPRAGQEQESIAKKRDDTAADVERRAVEMIDQDIAGLRGVHQLQSQDRLTKLDWFVASGMGLGGLAFALVAWVRRLMDETSEQRQLRQKQSRAARNFYKAISGMRGQGPAEEYAASLQRRFRQYLHDKSQEARFLTASQRELQELLLRHSVSEQALEKLARLLKDCDRYIYAPTVGEDIDQGNLVQRFREITEEIERSWQAIN